MKFTRKKGIGRTYTNLLGFTSKVKKLTTLTVYIRMTNTTSKNRCVLKYIDYLFQFYPQLLASRTKNNYNIGREQNIL